tara:strand:+ start:386 stop:784 length:399 start_codon:yes stop_codon:yes gene_type:complete
MHRVAMWFSFKKQPTRNLVFPYKAKSPTLKKIITYNEAELWEEIDRILLEDVDQKFTPGASLYYNLVHCADANYFITPTTGMHIEEYMVTKRFNVPIASNIDDAEYERLVIFSAIDEEYHAIITEEQKKKHG